MSRKRKTSHTSGLYRTRVTVGRDADGEPIRKALYARTAEELESKAAKLRAARGLGVAVTDGKSSWQYWAQLWLNLKRPDVGKSQATNCATAVKHLAPLNAIKMSEVRPMHVRRIVQQMYENGYGKRTVQLIISVAGQIGKLAKKNNACAVNVIEDVRAPKDAPVTERKPISAEEEKLLWNVKPIPPKTKSDAERAARVPEARMFALVQLNCGLRREEAAAADERGERADAEGLDGEEPQVEQRVPRAALDEDEGDQAGDRQREQSEDQRRENFYRTFFV